MAVPFRLHVAWLVFAAVLAWSLGQHLFPFLVPELGTGSYRLMALGGCIVYLASIVLRELIRVLVARSLHAPLHAITVHVFGGVFEQRDARLAPKQVLALAATGLVASLAIGAVVALLLLQLVDTRTPLALVALGFFTALANWLLAIVNAVLDGVLGIGRWLRARVSTTGRSR